MKIDVCVPIVGPRSAQLLETCLSTLYRHNDMSGVSVHLIDKEGRLDVAQVIARYTGAFVHALPQRFGEVYGAKSQIVTHAVSDTALTCEWALEHCGDAEWCALLHTDVEFLADALSRFRAEATSETGQIGQHSRGMVAYRRRAVEQCSVGFSSFAGLYLVRDDGVNWKLRHGIDPRCADRSLPVLGFDVGELLELNICAKGWRLGVLSDDEWAGLLRHSRGGSDWYQSETIFSDPS